MALSRTLARPSDTAVSHQSPRSRRKGLGRKVFWHACLIVVVALVLYPIVWLLASSFKPAAQIISSYALWPEHFITSNYSAGWRSIPGSTFLHIFVNSFIVAGLAVLGNIVACSLTGYAFARLNFRFRKTFFAVMIGTLLLPYHVLIVPQFIIFRHLGWVNTFLPLVVPKFAATDAFFVFLMVQFMRGLPPDLDEAAVLDGCGAFRRYLYIILPLSRPALVTTAIFTFVWTWNDFFTQLVYLNSQSKFTVPLGLNLFIDQTSQSAYGPLFAMSVLSLVPIFLFFLAFQKLLVQGVATTGLKG